MHSNLMEKKATSSFLMKMLQLCFCQGGGCLGILGKYWFPARIRFLLTHNDSQKLVNDSYHIPHLNDRQQRFDFQALPFIE
jgi:hypothetical protein